MNSNNPIKLNTTTFYVALKQNILYEAWNVIYFKIQELAIADFNATYNLF